MKYKDIEKIILTLLIDLAEKKQIGWWKIC